jgi:hypothetical protein
MLLGSLLIATGVMGQAKVCRKHPEWTETECKNVADKKLFVGMTREMIDAEKPRNCIRDRHPRDRGALQFICYSQWDRSEPEHLYPYLLHFELVDGRVSAFSYN